MQQSQYSQFQQQHYQQPAQPDVQPQQQWQWQQPYPPQKPPVKKPQMSWIWLLTALMTGVIVGMIVGYAIHTPVVSPDSTTTVNTQAAEQPTVIPTTQPTVIPTTAPKPKPTVKPAPTQSPVQIERAYKTGTVNTTIDALDKDGNSDQGKDVHFTGTIGNFVKDDSGNTAGANINTPASSFSLSVVQVAFPSNTDLSRLNQGDTIEVWGVDDGVSSGQNAYGGTVQEVGITTLYMTDQTTGYQANG